MAEATSQEAQGPPGTPPPVKEGETLQDRVVALAVWVITHPRIKDKSTSSMASHIAQHLNKEGFAKDAGITFFTRDKVIEIFKSDEVQKRIGKLIQRD